MTRSFALEDSRDRRCDLARGLAGSLAAAEAETARRDDPELDDGARYRAPRARAARA
jgi:hypothetical protein